MASPERPGALVDAAAAPARRGGRLIELVKHAGRFLFAYVVFEIATAFVWGLLGALQVGRVSSREVLNAVVVFVVLSAPTAWLPLSLALNLGLRARTRPLIACLGAGTVTGMILAIECATVFAWLDTISFDTAPPKNGSLDWLGVARALPESLSCVPSAAVGGLLFWAGCFWRPGRFAARRLEQA